MFKNFDVDECSEDDVKQNTRKNLRKDCLSEKQLPSAELNTAAEKPAADVILATQTSASDFVRTGLLYLHLRCYVLAETNYDMLYQ